MSFSASHLKRLDRLIENMELQNKTLGSVIFKEFCGLDKAHILNNFHYKISQLLFTFSNKVQIKSKFID